MMFGGLSEKLQTAVSKMSGQSSLTEENIKDALRDVRLALLEADVNFLLVKEVVEQIRQKAVGVALEKGVQPAQKLFSLVHEQLVELLGGEQATPFQLSSGRQHKILMVGLQGSGKTTTAGKLARYFKDLKPTLVAADIYRPAAISQLATVAKQAGADFYQAGQKDPVEIAREGLAKAKESNSRLVILDTAGRLQIDEDLMNELIRVKAAFEPDHILMVLDSMTGQEAIKVAPPRFNLKTIMIPPASPMLANYIPKGSFPLSRFAGLKKPAFFICFIACFICSNCLSKWLICWALVPEPWATLRFLEPFRMEGSCLSWGVMELIIATVRFISCSTPPSCSSPIIWPTPGIIFNRSPIGM